MKHHLHKTGLSLSAATSISNLCYQRGQEIIMQLSGVNNASRSFELNGKSFIEEAGKPLPDNTKDLLIEMGKLHATQAFLVSNIKIKDLMLQQLKMKSFTSKLEAPKSPEYKKYTNVSLVDDSWGWDQLTPEEYAEFLEAEALAAHIGKFIHKGGVLSALREELPTIKSIGWVSVKDGERIPVTVTTHHESKNLLKTHEDLATLHRKYESRVNYFKAKVKNLVTDENARIAKENGVKQAEVNKENESLRATYNTEHAKYLADMKVEHEEFETKRQEDIKATAALRIKVDPRFQETVDLFLKGLDEESGEAK